MRNIQRRTKPMPVHHDLSFFIFHSQSSRYNDRNNRIQVTFRSSIVSRTITYWEIAWLVVFLRPNQEGGAFDQ